jgi:hypothetical protein
MSLLSSSGKHQADNGEAGRIDSKIIPVLREAILAVQMVLYRCLKKNISNRFPDWPVEKQGRLAGAVVNNLFGSVPADSEVAHFASEHRQLVEDELRGIGDYHKELLPFLTDALRMQTICDNQEGIHSVGSLLIARTLGLLQEQRNLPLPTPFMLSVRNLAAAHNIVEPIQVAPAPPQSTT